MIKLVILGTTDHSELLHHYFSRTNSYEVVGFCVHSNFRKSDEFLGLPLVDFETMGNVFPPDSHQLFVSVGFRNMNDDRARVCEEGRRYGYTLASYISPHSCNLSDEPIGDNVFVFEQVIIQPFVKIMDNCVIWAGTSLGHHSIIDPNCYISGNVSIGARTHLGRNSFVGLASTIQPKLTIGERNLIGAHCHVAKNTAPGSVFRSEQSKLMPRTSDFYQRFL